MSNSTQPGWKLCQRCGGLFFTGMSATPGCRDSVDGKGKHDFGEKPGSTPSTPHTLTKVDPWEEITSNAQNDIFNAEVQGANWAYCINCHGLFHVTGSANPNECNHSTAGHVKDSPTIKSGNYRLEAHETNGTPPKNAYYECRHCRGLYNDSMTMVCNANSGGIHEQVMGVNDPPYFILH